MGLKYNARIQLDAFEELFKDRLAGSLAKIPRAMELSFQNPLSQQEENIWKLIEDFHAAERQEDERALFALRTRQNAAERKLSSKITKTATNDLRIAKEKIDKILAKFAGSSNEMSEYARIFPHVYSPLLVEERGERVIKPFRYLLRPQAEGPNFDRDFGGSYNARRERLQEVFWWKNVYGKNHGVLIISKFWENVKKEDYEKKSLAPGEPSQNLVLEFSPQDELEMLVPCIFDQNKKDRFTLNSFALITDEPNPEVKAAGHDRTPVILKPEYLDRWLMTSKHALADFEIVFKDKRSTYFEHRIAA